MKLSIIVPAYNEQKTIGKILDKLLNIDLGKWEKEIIVVNDSSTDKTALLLKKYSRKRAVSIVGHVQNQGKTAAIRTGIQKSSGDYVIIQDADLEYEPNDIPILLAVASRYPRFVVYGSRFTGRHVDTVTGHKLGNFLLTTLTNLLYSADVSDMETCYKLIPRDYFKNIKIETSRFGFEPEITAKLLRMGKEIVEVPISYSKRTVTEGKNIRWWKDGWATVWILIKYRFLTE